MLSKVLKGSGARHIPAMTFAEALAPVRQPRPDSSTTPASEEQSVLLNRIRTLEAELAATRQAAFESGRIKGEQDASAAIAPLIARLNASIADVMALRPELRRGAEKDAVDLALKIARRILHRELSVDANALNALARVVFDRLTRAENWQLTVNPRFADAIRGALPATAMDRVQIKIDPGCDAGTLIMSCAEGVIDASIESQLAEISSGLTDRLNQ